MKRKSRVCRICGVELLESRHSQYCPECAMKVQAEAIEQLRQKQGPIYDKWRENLRKSLEARLHE